MPVFIAKGEPASTAQGAESADSIVLSGGYEDDQDLGDTIIYTGEGGRDSKTKKQVADQKFTRGNLALAVSHLRGLPVRVTSGARHRSPYSPSFGAPFVALSPP